MVIHSKVRDGKGEQNQRGLRKGTNSVVELVALSKAAALSACRSQPSHLPMLVNWFGDPLGVRISSDSFMEWINEDNFKESVH